MTYTVFPVVAGDLDAEDGKLVRLARTAALRAHVSAPGTGQGAAVRDNDGRTYAAATVEHPDARLTTSALRGALSAAFSSGARRFEALVVLPAGPDGLSDDDRTLVAALAPGTPVLCADLSGAVVGVVSA